MNKWKNSYNTETIYLWGCEWRMEFSLSLDRCVNSSCMCCELDLYIPPLNDRVRGLFYLLTWMVWCRLSSSWHCCNPSIVLRSAVSWGFYSPRVVYIWLLQLRPGPKTYQWRHPPYSLAAVQSIINHCVSHRCSFHMVHDVGIVWWKILMTMAYTNLVHITYFWNPRIWQMVNVVGILFL